MISADTPPATKRHRHVAIFLGLWTVFAGTVAWWLIHAGATQLQSELIFDSGQSSQIPLSEQIRRWLKIADLSFRGTYPWILMAPYVGWLAWRFQIEAGRLRTSLPIHVAACALFAFASYSLSKHLLEKKSVVMVVAEHRKENSLPSILTNESLRSTEHGGDLVSVRTYVSEANQFNARVVMSSHGEVKAFDLTNRADMTNLSLLKELNTNLAEKIGPILSGGPGVIAAGFAGSAAGPPVNGPLRFQARFFAHLLNVLAYGALAGLAHAIHFYRRFRERERRAIWLESHLAKARLHALQAQLQPHFLFNALNAVATLLRRNPAAAQEALTSFSDLLRLALSQSNQQEITLREDLRFVERYVEIQQTRLGDRFQFEQEIEPATLECVAPSLFLQPLVENSLRHGIEPSSGPSFVRIAARKQGNRLALSVEDNGVGLKDPNDSFRPGIGLSNLRARLEALYPGAHLLEIGPREGGGVLVRLEIPFHTATMSASRSPVEQGEGVEIAAASARGRTQV